MTTSLEQLYERHGHHVYRRALRLLGDEASAWDATQEVFLKADAALGRFEGRSSSLTWLTRIATNHCLNVIRSRKVRRGQGLTDAETLEGDATGGGGGRRSMEAAAQLNQLLTRFDEETRAMAVFYYVEEMSQEEVAQAVGCSVPTLRKRLRAFVRRARALLGVDPKATTAAAPST